MQWPSVGEVLLTLLAIVFLCIIAGAVDTWREMRKWEREKKKGDNSGKTD